jgi:DNA transposition AAA+ family ATPase|nr:MAG TPA: putative transposase [Caudoviricetes sp.]
MPFNDDLKTVEMLKAHIAETGITQKQLARKLDVSDTVLSLFLANSYTGDNKKIVEKAKQYLHIGAVRKALTPNPDYCESLLNTQRITECLQMAHASNEILLLYGPAGCGKTTALKHYAENNNGVTYIEADATTGTPRAILLTLLESIGGQPIGSTTQVMKSILNTLRETNRLIIIDEAQHLTERSFDTIRAINDKIGIGIVYSGNPSILKQMYGRKEQEFDQLYSRIGLHCELANKYSLDDIRNIFSGLDVSEECIKYLKKAAQKKGGLRLMIKQYKNAANIAAALGQSLTVDYLEEAARRMSIGGQGLASYS